jgi:hypothetical protein
MTADGSSLRRRSFFNRASDGIAPAETRRFSPPSTRFDKIVICSGHMIDAPDRKDSRFPAAKAEAVRARIAEYLDEWHVGKGDLAVCGGACGADILFAEECLRRGAHIRLLLAQQVDDFVRDSVQHAGSDWIRRFHALRKKAEVATLLPKPRGKDANDLSIYERNNLWIIDTARRQAVESARLYALLVWDEKTTGDGPGGTSDFAQRVRDLGGVVSIINPRTILSEDGRNI